MRFEVPQFIEVEDKIFGPFTWKQFIYLMGGGGLAAVLFLTTHFIVFLIVGMPIAALAALLAFYPVNNRPFSIFLESMVRYMTGTKLYLWRKQPATELKDVAAVAAPDAETAATVAQNVHVPTVTKTHLTSLSRRLELNAIDK
jgi:hypothetical protein